MGFGHSEALAAHADVLALGDRVVLVWKEFDGKRSLLYAMQSHDRGVQWSAASVVGNSGAESDHPDLITNGERISVSWNSTDSGHRLIPIP
jgi:hypothetical protein